MAPSFAKKIFAVVFLFATVGATLANLALRSADFGRGLAGLAAPASPDGVAGSMRGLDRFLAATVAGDVCFVEAYGRLQALQGKRSIDDFALVKDDNGFLNVGALLPPDLSRLAIYASRVQWLKRLAARDGANVIFVNPPDRVLEGYSSYTRGLPYQNRNPLQDSFLYFLWEYRVEYLDARTALAASELPPEKWLFKTDPRWTPQAAFATFRRLVAKMDEVFQGKLDPDGKYADPANYRLSTFSRAFLGDWGRRTGAAFAGLDDFTVVRPNFDDEYAVEWVDAAGAYETVEGGLEETLLNPAALRPAGVYGFAPYDYYALSDKHWARIKNLRHHNRPRLLLVHDADGAALAPFLAPMFGETHTIRSASGEFAVNVDQYLSSYRFDYVIVALGPASYSNQGMNFFTNAKNQ